MANNPEPITPKSVVIEAISRLDRAPKPLMVAATFVIIGIVAFFDYVTGYEISCTVFYLLAIGMATWFVSGGFGVISSLVSLACTSVANLVTGQVYSNPFAPVWNAVILLSFYLIVVWLLRSLRIFQMTLESKVLDRTAILSEELAERERLQNEVLAISEREQRRIGHDIHDTLCQHLTGTALAEQFLLQKLAAKYAPEVEDAERVVTLIEEAIFIARGLAAGLSPLETEGEGLLTALADLASHFSTQFKVACHFTCDDLILIKDSAVATHLYRIAQEAIHNAVRHGKASQIRIRLDKHGQSLDLSVIDNGSGLPAGLPVRQGMGLRNMKYRASIIGGSLTLRAGRPGTILICAFPNPELSSPT